MDIDGFLLIILRSVESRSLYLSFWRIRLTTSTVTIYTGTHVAVSWPGQAWKISQTAFPSWSIAYFLYIKNSNFQCFLDRKLKQCCNHFFYIRSLFTSPVLEALLSLIVCLIFFVLRFVFLFVWNPEISDIHFSLSYYGGSCLEHSFVYQNLLTIVVAPFMG